MPHFQIKHRWTGAVLFEGNFDTMAGCVEAAIRTRVDLAGAVFAGAELVRARLVDANLAGANLADANLVRADLAGANLVGANLAGAKLVHARLVAANLAGADLAGADLAGAELVRARLVDANLVRADLASANLVRADLAGANLAGANLAGANLALAKWKEGYTLRRAPVRTAQRGDGYTFYLLDTEEGGWRISAGCRFFTPEEAWAHWERTRPEDGPGTLGAETRDILTMFELAIEREARNAP
jgi:hypothetical protein